MKTEKKFHSFGILEISYSKKEQLLIVVVANHGRNQALEYSGVPEKTFKEFLDAPSKGSFFNSKIRNKYNHVSTTDV